MSIHFRNQEERQAYGTELKLFLPEMGDLQKQLYQGEYEPFKYVPVFESNFVQVTKRGEVVDIHNQVTLVTLGIAATSPVLPLPNVMLLARPLCDPCNYKTSHPESLQLSRLFPLKFVKITITDAGQRQLKLKLANGRTFYLQLYAPPEKVDELFERWVKLIYLLRPPPVESGTEYSHDSRPTSVSTMEPTKMGRSTEMQEELDQHISLKEEDIPPHTAEAGKDEAKDEKTMREKEEEEDEEEEEKQDKEEEAKYKHPNGEETRESPKTTEFLESIKEMLAESEKELSPESEKELSPESDKEMSPESDKEMLPVSENKEKQEVSKKRRKYPTSQNSSMKKIKRKISRTKPENSQVEVSQKESKLSSLLKIISKTSGSELTRSTVKKDKDKAREKIKPKKKRIPSEGEHNKKVSETDKGKKKSKKKPVLLELEQSEEILETDQDREKSKEKPTLSDPEQTKEVLQTE